MSRNPKGWVNASLRDLISKNGLFTDGDWVESKDQDPFGNIRLLQLADIGDGKFLDKSSRYINDTKFIELRCTELHAGDVLVARMPDPLGRACLMPDLPQRCVTVVDVAAIRPGPDSALTTWLMHTINAPQIREAIALQSSGTTRKRISRGNLGDLTIPVPPLREQQRIADKLDTVLARVGACRDRLARVAPLIKRFRQSVLDAATAGRLTADLRPSQEPAFEWRNVRLGDIADIQGGVTKDSKKQSDADPEVPYLRVANVQRGFLDLAEMKTIRIPAEKLAGLTLAVGDILFNEGGDLDKLGRGWIWEGQIKICSFQNHVFRARLHDLRNSPKYISWWGNSRGLEYFLRSGKQTTNLASINKTMLGNLPISLPQPEEQAEIVSRVEVLFAYADRLEARLAQAQSAADRLTPALLAKAFRGELVPQDPADEPASVLLQRLRAASADNGSASPARKRGPPKRTQRAAAKPEGLVQDSP